MTVNNIISEKWEKVYQTIPEDGSIIRFKDIAEKLQGFSRSTIAKSLDFFCHSGYVKKEIISKKNVQYSRTERISKRGFELFNKLKDGSGMEDQTVGLGVLFMNPAYCHDLLVNLKEKGLQDTFIAAQATAIFLGLKELNLILLKMLLNYADNPNKTKRKSAFILARQLEYLPQLDRLTTLIDDVGLDDMAMAAVLKKEFGFTQASLGEIKEILKKRRN